MLKCTLNKEDNLIIDKDDKRLGNSNKKGCNLYGK